MAVAVEGLAKFRHVVVAVAKSKARGNSSSSRTTAVARYSIPVLHGLQAAAGYTLMLLAMTFSLELLCSVVAGLATGYAIFFKLPTPAADGGADNDPYQLRQHVTTNPCCEFMEEESKETAGNGLRPPSAAAARLQNNSGGEEDLTLILEGEEETAAAPAPSRKPAASRARGTRTPNVV